MLQAIRRASSRVNSLAVARRPGSSSNRHQRLAFLVLFTIGALVAIKTLGEVLHIGPSEVGRMGASQVPRWSMVASQVPRWSMCLGVSRIAAREEVARIAGYRDLIRRPDQKGAARRRKPPEPHNLAHKMRGESQLFRQ